MRQEEAGIANLTNASSCRPVPGLQFLVTAVTNYDLPAHSILKIAVWWLYEQLRRIAALYFSKPTVRLVYPVCPPPQDILAAPFPAPADCSILHCLFFLSAPVVRIKSNCEAATTTGYGRLYSAVQGEQAAGIQRCSRRLEKKKSSKKMVSLQRQDNYLTKCIFLFVITS